MAAPVSSISSLDPAAGRPDPARSGPERPSPTGSIHPHCRRPPSRRISPPWPPGTLPGSCSRAGRRSVRGVVRIDQRSPEPPLALRWAATSPGNLAPLGQPSQAQQQPKTASAPRPSSSARPSRSQPARSDRSTDLGRAQQDCFFLIEFRKHSECEDSFDYVGSSSSWTRSSSKRDLKQDDHFPGYHYYHGHARCLVSIAVSLPTTCCQASQMP